MATGDDMEIINAANEEVSIFNFDIDGNGTIAAESDGFLLVRYLFGYRGSDLITGLIASGATRETGEEIAAYLDELNDLGLLDVDGDGKVNALTDGVLTVRAQLGRTGEDLTRGAIGTEATLTASEIEEFLAPLNSIEGIVIEEFGFDLTTATDLGSISGSASISDATDFFEEGFDIYKFSIDSPSDMTITISGLDANADADILLIEDINGNGMVSEEEEFAEEIIDVSFAGGFGGDETIATILLPGEYFVVVESFAGQTNYDLSFAATTVTIPDDGAGNNGNAARDIGTLGTDEQVFNDFVGDADDRDIYKFNLDAESDVSISLSNLSADADWLIIQDLNGDGREQEEEFIDGSFNEGNAAEIGTIRLADGEYFLVVEQFEGNTTYDLAISAAAAPEIPALSQAIDLATPNDTVNDSVSDENPIDLYSFTLDRSSEVTLTLEGLSADADLYLLQDINGNGQIDADGRSEEGEVVNFSDEPETTSETISDFLEAGTYYVTVEQFQGNTDYSLNLTTEAIVVAEDGNETIAQGGDLGPIRDDMGGLNPMTFSDRVGDNDPIDYYTFRIFDPPNLPNVEQPRVDLDVRLEMRGGNADLRVILDENGNGEVDEEEVVDISANPGKEPDYIFIPDLEAGTYIIEVAQFSGEVQYDLTIAPKNSSNPRDTRPDDLNEIFGTDGIILTEEPVMFSDFLGKRDRMDWYKFTILQDGELDITLTGMSDDADLSLIADVNGNGQTDAGERILISANNSNNDESIRTGALPAGDYFVSVNQYDGETDYTLTAFTTPSSVAGMIPEVRVGLSMATAIARSSANFAASGAVNPGNPFVFYSFTVDRSGIFTANLTGLDENADVRLIRDFNNNQMIDPVVDRNGNQYIDNEEVEIRAWLPNGGTESEQIRAFLEPGEYFLQVTNSVQKQTTNYNVETRFQTAQRDPQDFVIEVALTEAAQMVLADPLEEAITKAGEFWERVISHSTFSGKHTVSIAVDVDELGEGVLASAGPTALRRDANGNSMTVRGDATINSNPKIQGLYDRDLQYFYDTMIHEIGHVLGFFGGSNQTTALRGSSGSTDGSSASTSQRVASLPSLTDRNLVTDDESNPVYNADTFAGIAYGELLETFEPTALELTRGAGSGSDLSHWWEDVFGNEMMTESGSAGINELLGTITIGAMRDLGFNVNYGAVEPYTLEM